MQKHLIILAGVALITAGAALAQQKKDGADPVLVNKAHRDRAGRRSHPIGRRASTRTRRRKPAASTATARPRTSPRPSSRASRRRSSYPADGKLMGDWKNGEKLAQSGYGGRFTDYPARQPNGGNCYACHQLAKARSATARWGRASWSTVRSASIAEADIKAVYERIYNPHAAIAVRKHATIGCQQVPYDRSDPGLGGLCDVSRQPGEQVG